MPRTRSRSGMTGWSFTHGEALAEAHERKQTTPRKTKRRSNIAHVSKQDAHQHVHAEHASLRHSTRA